MAEFDGSNKTGLILEKLCIDPFSIHKRTDGNHIQINLDDPEVVDFALKHKNPSAVTSLNKLCQKYAITPSQSTTDVEEIVTFCRKHDLSFNRKQYELIYKNEHTAADIINYSINAVYGEYTTHKSSADDPLSDLKIATVRKWANGSIQPHPTYDSFDRAKKQIEEYLSERNTDIDCTDIALLPFLAARRAFTPVIDSRNWKPFLPIIWAALAVECKQNIDTKNKPSGRLTSYIEKQITTLESTLKFHSQPNVEVAKLKIGWLETKLGAAKALTGLIHLPLIAQQLSDYAIHAYSRETCLPPKQTLSPSRQHVSDLSLY